MWRGNRFGFSDNVKEEYEKQALCISKEGVKCAQNKNTFQCQ
jgi:hypothetical protein